MCTLCTVNGHCLFGWHPDVFLPLAWNMEVGCSSLYWTGWGRIDAGRTEDGGKRKWGAEGEYKGGGRGGTIGWRDFALFKFFENTHIPVDQVCF